MQLNMEISVRFLATLLGKRWWNNICIEIILIKKSNSRPYAVELPVY